MYERVNEGENPFTDLFEFECGSVPKPVVPKSLQTSGALYIIDRKMESRIKAMEMHFFLIHNRRTDYIKQN